MREHLQHKVFTIISDIAQAQQLEVFAIGGFVRDSILKRPCKDIDIVVKGSGISLAEQVAAAIGPGCQVNIFKNFGTAMLHFEDYDIEFVGARKESYHADSRKPAVEEGTLEDDQNRRDFTINALFYNPLTEKVLDFTGQGISDMEHGIVRGIGNIALRFEEDPVRLLRALK
ncbi:MAG TPA: tRNA nucleotidyltransferase, partial [Bacteroidales bacterium]|nr:tRNA nucleotidyltransferase [Bacteroidales bacterium]